MDRDIISKDAQLVVAHANHLATLEEALRILDIDGFFGTGADRESVLLTVEVTPPDHMNVGFARRLNPDGPLLDEWLTTVAELPLLDPDPVATAELAEVSEPLAPPPNVTMARLWRRTPGLYLLDGTAIYGPHSIRERNETYEAAEYCPEWVLIGDDGGGRDISCVPRETFSIPHRGVMPPMSTSSITVRSPSISRRSVSSSPATFSDGWCASE